MFKEFKPLFKESKFGYLWTSQLLSQLTVNMMNFLLLFRLFAITGSSIATSLLWVFYALPAIFFGPVGSAAADILSRKSVLRASILGQATTIFFYAFLHQSKLFLLYGVVLSYSFFNQFYVPAEASALPSLVPKKYLPQANSLFFLTQQTALVIGFSLSGVFRNLIGFNNTLFLCSALLLLAFVALAFLPKLEAEDAIPTNFESAVGAFFGSIVEGYTYIRGKKQILVPFLLLGGSQVFLAILLVNVPIFVKEILNVNVLSVGIEVIFPTVMGALLGAVFSTKLLREGWSKKRLVENCLIGLSFSLYVLVFFVPELRSLFRPVLGVLMLSIAGASYVGLIVSTQTYLQEVTPEDLRGRVFGNFWFMVTIASIFPVIFSGTITELFGIKMLLLIMAGVTFGVLLYSKKIDADFLKEVKHE
ncbi:MFS transporter [Candidatus Woesebacteria bacterium]|nr:MFS transporter [Candidatus Woesebacteria bacterium]